MENTTLIVTKYQLFKYTEQGSRLPEDLLNIIEQTVFGELEQIAIMYKNSLLVAESLIINSDRNLRYSYEDFKYSPFEYVQLLKSLIYAHNLEYNPTYNKIKNIENYSTDYQVDLTRDIYDWDIFLLDVLDGKFVIINRYEDSIYNEEEMRDLIFSYLFDDEITLKHIKTELNDIDETADRLIFANEDDIERLKNLDKRLREYSKIYRDYVI